MKIASLNGRLVDEAELLIPLSAISVAYSTAFFEAFRLYKTAAGNGRLHNLERHLTRFQSTINYFAPSANFRFESVLDAIISVIAANAIQEDCYFKLLGFWPQTSKTASIFRLRDLEPSFLLTANTNLKVSPEAVQRLQFFNGDRLPFNLPTHVKATANYYHFRKDLADAQQNGFTNLLFLRENEYVTEAIDSTIIFIRTSGLVAIPLSERVLPSITRLSILNVAAESGFEIEERSVHRSEIGTFSGAFLCNTAYGIRPIEKIGDTDFTTDSSGLLDKLRNALAEQQRRVDGNTGELVQFA